MEDYKNLLKNAIVVLDDIKEELVETKKELLKRYKEVIGDEKWVLTAINVTSDILISTIESKLRRVIKELLRGDF